MLYIIKKISLYKPSFIAHKKINAMLSYYNSTAGLFGNPFLPSTPIVLIDAVTRTDDEIVGIL